jgi:hypothetical protein
VLLVTISAFFLAEMGDKTQVATVVLAAQYSPLWQVIVGTTLGMLLANVPVVWLGARFADRLPLARRTHHRGTAVHRAGGMDRAALSACVFRSCAACAACEQTASSFLRRFRRCAA